MALLPKLKPMILECFSVGVSWLISELINKNSIESQPTFCQDHAPDEVEEFSHTLKKEVVLECEEKNDPDAPSADEKDGTEDPPFPTHCLTMRDPCFRTKDVPPHILYSLRGVRCKLCWLLIKGTKAVQRLLKHTKEVHPHKATDSFLNKLRRDNAFDKVIGNGIRYCTCPYCKIFGIARFHDGFWKRPGC
ncbi:hypothetical protein ONE63_011146 [Megalurothrips usitatus]|uniref:Uncharacterized protein n=1 Tax=Megalurothrips usitatus TaxID=439358 RepID=A0AAV7XH28_9NEOP|nr:hypothetical protein ONE63_011146 [Megalurothrips usitatus]